jgi:hypothetical protein
MQPVGGGGEKSAKGEMIRQTGGGANMRFSVIDLDWTPLNTMPTEGTIKVATAKGASQR